MKFCCSFPWYLLHLSSPTSGVWPGSPSDPESTLNNRCSIECLYILAKCSKLCSELNGHSCALLGKFACRKDGGGPEADPREADPIDQNPSVPGFLCSCAKWAFGFPLPFKITLQDSPFPQSSGVVEVPFVQTPVCLVSCFWGNFTMQGALFLQFLVLLQNGGSRGFPVAFRLRMPRSFRNKSRLRHLLLVLHHLWARPA